MGFHLAGNDIFMNVAGGVKLDEPAVDLAVVCAMASSFLDKPAPKKTVVMGEVGLAGEVRAIGQMEQRLAEARKMGFSRAVVPEGSLKTATLPKHMKITGVASVASAVEMVFQ